MWRHAESNNHALFAEILEDKRLVALVTISNEQLVTTDCLGHCMLDKVLELV